MNFNLPKKITVWIAVALAVIGIVIYIVHLLAQNIPYLQPAAFALEFLAFLLLFLGLTLKGF